MNTQRPFTDDFRPDMRQWLVWIPTAIGIGLLLGILVTFGRLAFMPAPPGRESLLPEPVVAVLPSMTPVATSTPSSAAPRPSANPSPTPRETVPPGHDSGRGRPPHKVTPVPGRPATPSPSKRPPRPKPTKTTPPETAAITGRYQVLNAWGEGFIGEVLIGNDSGQPRDWTVVLRFPDSVGRLYTSWVEGAPQATLTREGDTYVWHSGVPLGARSSVPLRFQFARQGSGMSPSLCTVNGTSCGD